MEANMKNKIKYLLLIFMIIINCKLFSQTEYSAINTKSDERTIAFSVLNNSNMQIWRTTGDACKNKLSRRIDISSGQSINFKPADLLNRKQNAEASIEYDGSPAFPICYNDSTYFNWGVMVSNKFFDNKDYDNDIYEIVYNPLKNNWEIGRRIDEINSKYWDDTPALSSDGKVIVFASNRVNPKASKTDLFLSIRNNNRWSEPELLTNISSKNYSEVSPFFGPDGYLYFSSNKSGDFDIYRIKLDANCKPSGSIEQLPDNKFPGVNRSGSNEVSPCFSPGGQFFLFSSDRKNGSSDFDFYYIKANQILDFSEEINFNVHCWELRDTLDFYKEIQRREKKPCPAKLNISDGLNTLNKQTDKSGFVDFSISRYNGKQPHLDMFVRNAKLTVKGDCCNAEREFNIVFNSFCQQKLTSDLELFCESKPITKFPFIIDSVPFFVTSYWCPSTNQYKDKEDCGCTSIFNLKRKCDVTPPEYQVDFDYECESNEVYTFSGKYNPVILPSYNVTKTAGSCIDISEMNNVLNKKKGFDWSDRVDAQITSLVKQLERALNNVYIKYATDKGKKLIINVYGWTDLRPLDNKCFYTGDDIDLTNSIIQLEEKATLYGDSVVKKYINNNVIKKGTRFVNQWRSGNQLLSDLRAYYMAHLLNNQWKKIDKFNQLVDNKQVEIRAIGRGIKDKPGIPLHYNRSVDVEVVIDQGDKLFYESVEGLNPVETIIFRVNNCNCNKIQ